METDAAVVMLLESTECKGLKHVTNIWDEDSSLSRNLCDALWNKEGNNNYVGEEDWKGNISNQLEGTLSTFKKGKFLIEEMITLLLGETDSLNL